MDYQINVKPWSEAHYEAVSIRYEVFVGEQKVPVEIEIDEFDEDAWHAVVFDANKAIATARLVVEKNGLNQVGRIGRMAVLKQFRHLGIGSALLRALLDFGLVHGIRDYYLHAQVSAQRFYEKEGFISEGEIFEEAGILHQSMRLKI